MIFHNFIKTAIRINKKLSHTILQLKWRLILGKKVGVIGDFFVANPSRLVIGENCGINHDVFILAHNRIEIGNNVIISARAMLLDTGLDIKNLATIDYSPHLDSFIKIEDGAWIGAGAIILPGTTVGRKSVVGAGSVVTKDVPPFTVVAGNPAKIIGRTDA